jgi:hypothetical protein
MVVINKLLNFFGILSLERFQENIVLNVLYNVVVDVLEGLSALKPLLLILFIEVTLPNPESAILSTFFFLELSSNLGL